MVGPCRNRHDGDASLPGCAAACSASTTSRRGEYVGCGPGRRRESTACGPAGGRVQGRAGARPAAGEWMEALAGDMIAAAAALCCCWTYVVV